MNVELRRKKTEEWGTIIGAILLALATVNAADTNTVMGRLAASMKPDSWAEFKAEGWKGKTHTRTGPVFQYLHSLAGVLPGSPSEKLPSPGNHDP